MTRLINRRDVQWGIATLALACVASSSPSKAKTDPKPPVPAGVDPGGIRVGIIGSGLDYTVPAIARRLARDGEGTLIGVDYVDRDFAPFERTITGSDPGEGAGTRFASALLMAAPNATLVPVKVATPTRDVDSIRVAGQQLLGNIDTPLFASARIVVPVIPLPDTIAGEETTQMQWERAMVGGGFRRLIERAASTATPSKWNRGPFHRPLVILPTVDLVAADPNTDQGSDTPHVLVVAGYDRSDPADAPPTGPVDVVVALDATQAPRRPGYSKHHHATALVAAQAVALTAKNPALTAPQLRRALVAAARPDPSRPTARFGQLGHLAP